MYDLSLCSLLTMRLHATTRLDLLKRQQGIVAGIAAIAIEENERTLGYREQYVCASTVVPDSTWQSRCNAQFLESFNNYEASGKFPNAGRQG